MKKYFIPIYLFAILLCGSSVYGQDKIIEVAISFDKSFEDLAGDAEARIMDVMSKTEKIYKSFKIKFKIVKIEDFGNVNLGTDRLDALAQQWSKPQFCYKRDLVLHFKGDLPGIVGEANPSPIKLCYSNNVNLWNSSGSINKYVAITTFQNNTFREAETTAHEIGHLFGLRHEDSDFCDALASDQIGLMCVARKGSFNQNDNETYVFSNQFTNKINSVLNRSCVSFDNFNPNEVCTEVKAGWITDSEIDRTCNGDGFKEIRFMIVNDENQRSFTSNQISIDLDDELTYQGDILNLPKGPPEGSLKRVIYTVPNFTLAPYESYEFAFKINYDGVTTPYPNCADCITNLNWNSTITPAIEGLNPLFSRGVYIDDNSINLVGNTTTQDLLDIIERKKTMPHGHFTNFAIYIDGTLTVDEDLFLDMEYDFIMAENASINVINNSKFSLFEASVKPCDSERWNQIYVESGSSIDFREVDLYHGKYGIKTEIDPNNSNQLSNIHVERCEFNNFVYNAIDIRCNSESFVYRNKIQDCNYGIIVVGDFDIDMMSYNNINEAHCGIYLQDQSDFLDINNNTVTNSDFGFRLNNSSGLIERNTITNTFFCCVLNINVKSNIIDNTFSGSLRGLHIANSSSIKVTDNTIGLLSEAPDVAIRMHNVTATRIFDNKDILGNRIGIEANHSDVTIKDNSSISVNGFTGKNSGGILLTDCSGSQVLDNYIYAAHCTFGVESNNSISGVKIKNNFITMSPEFSTTNAAAIRSMGSDADDIQENVLFSYNSADGILIQNTSSNIIKCNDTNLSLIGLNILDNAASHHIEGNHHEDAAQYDMSISSVVGIQRHLGNDFVGGSVIANLDIVGIEDSRFYVNRDNDFHFPTDPDPKDDWFYHRDETDEECSGQNGPRSNFFNNEAALCRYYAHLKKLAKFNKKKYFVNIMHILNHSTRNPNFILPSCMTSDSLFQTLCGVRELTSLIYQVSKKGKDAHASELDNVLSQVTTRAERDQVFENLEIEYDAIKSQEISNINRERTRLDSLKTLIQSIDCEDEIVKLMTDTWIAYISHLLQNDGVTDSSPSDRTTEIAQLCSSEYGGGVHLARSFLSLQGDDLYFDVFDDCNVDNRSSLSTKAFEMNITPNPNNGVFTINIPSDVEGSLFIYNVSGGLIQSEESIDALNTITILKEGVYLIKFVSSTGQVQTKKVIVVK